MAQPNVAREPSMEEILASIRRIIESNDPTGDAAAMRPSASFDADDDIDDGLDFGPAIAANDVGMPVRAEERLHPVAAPAPVSAAPAVAAPERSLSLADVAARVRAASARQLEAHRASAQAPAALSPAPQPAPAAAATPAAQPKDIETPRYEPFAAPAAVAAPEVDMAPVKEEPMMEPLATTELPMPELSMPELRPTMSETLDAPEVSADQAVEAIEEMKDEDDKAVAASAEKPAGPQLPVAMDAFAGLLSEAAGAQVAKSFGELADVFNGLERRSVEEMAEDMLRPMLQDWLDDNLPTLVERLVREEIERVARGPRR